MSEKIIDNICILKAFSKRSQKIRIEYDCDAMFPWKTVCHDCVGSKTMTFEAGIHYVGNKFDPQNVRPWGKFYKFIHNYIMQVSITGKARKVHAAP